MQDPGNVGSMIRTAAAAGIDQVVLSPHCAFAWSPKALRAGQGAHFLTQLVENATSTLGSHVPRTRAGRWLQRVVAEAPSLYAPTCAGV